MHWAEQLGMKLVSCPVNDEKPVSTPPGALCNFLVPSWTLRPINPANTSFWCRLCRTLQITLMTLLLHVQTSVEWVLSLEG
jgi:hypothetical protein